MARAIVSTCMARTFLETQLTGVPAIKMRWSCRRYSPSAPPRLGKGRSAGSLLFPFSRVGRRDHAKGCSSQPSYDVASAKFASSGTCRRPIFGCSIRIARRSESGRYSHSEVAQRTSVGQGLRPTESGNTSPDLPCTILARHRAFPDIARVPSHEDKRGDGEGCKMACEWLRFGG